MPYSKVFKVILKFEYFFCTPTKINSFNCFFEA